MAAILRVPLLMVTFVSLLPAMRPAPVAIMHANGLPGGKSWRSLAIAHPAFASRADQVRGRALAAPSRPGSLFYVHRRYGA